MTENSKRYFYKSIKKQTKQTLLSLKEPTLIGQRFCFGFKWPQCSLATFKIFNAKKKSEEKSSFTIWNYTSA